MPKYTRVPTSERSAERSAETGERGWLAGLVAPGGTADDGRGTPEPERFAGPLAVVAVLKLAAELVVLLATDVWSVAGTQTSLLDDWTGQVEGTMTEPEPGTKELVWSAAAAAWATDLAVGLAAVPGLPRLIGRLANRQAAAALCWIALVLMAAAGDAILHHVASNVDATTGPLMPVGLALNTGFLGVLALAEFWDSIQDDE